MPPDAVAAPPQGSSALPPGWRLRCTDDSDVPRELAAALAIPDSLSRILVGRGMQEAADARAFLRPSLDGLHDPSLLPDLGRATAAIRGALDAGRKIFVHGDFDADGMTAAALMVRGLRRLGGTVVGFVPHRIRDGYDLSLGAVERASRASAGLIVTVDCGVSAHAAVRAASERGIGVVVTDHHLPGDELPPALAVVNPNRTDSVYPFRSLAGVGVAFKVLTELYRQAEVPEPELLQHLDLVAVGTIADRMPLLGENRCLVRAGLRALERTRKPGLRELVAMAGVGRGEPVPADAVAFRLAPMLNAVGRMSGAQLGLDLLIGDDPTAVAPLVAELEQHNRERRVVDRQVIEAAEAFLADRPDAPALVAWGTGWHRGVLGLVASRLVDRYGKPAIVLGVEGDEVAGSGRSIPEIPLDAVLARCADLLDRYGGHGGAAGLSLRADRVGPFAERFRAVVSEYAVPPAARSGLDVDLVLPLSAMTDDLCEELAHLEPHGESNPTPLIACTGLVLRNARTVGAEDEHLAGILSDGSHELRAIGFGMGGRLEEVEASSALHAAFHLEREMFRGEARRQARLVALQRAGR